jgi:hypothetical protein
MRPGVPVPLNPVMDADVFAFMARMNRRMQTPYIFLEVRIENPLDF